MNRFIGLTVSAAALMFWACGDQETVTYRVQQPMVMFADDEELPGCGKTEKNQIYKLDGLYFCDGKKWVELAGAQGGKGETGEDGTYSNISGEDTLKIYGAVCGTETYDPEGGKFCSGISLMDKCGGKEYNPSITWSSRSEAGRCGRPSRRR